MFLNQEIRIQRYEQVPFWGFRGENIEAELERCNQKSG